jgi:hypothetical protein
MTTTPTAPVRTSGAPTHACVRCGAPVSIDVALCDDCNPLGLAQPAATQVHAIAAGGIFVFVIFLAVVARLAVAGVGPFDASVVQAVHVPDGLRVTLAITNRGSKGAETTCALVDPEHRFDRANVRVSTPYLPAGETVTFDRELVEFGAAPIPLQLTCQTP